MRKLTLTFDPVSQNQKGLSSHHGERACEVWKWSGKNCWCYRVHKVKCDGPMHIRTHSPTRSLTQPPTNGRVTISPPTLLRGDNMHALTHEPTHSLTQPPTNGRVTISPPTLLRGDNMHALTHEPTHSLTQPPPTAALLYLLQLCCKGIICMHSPTNPLTHSPNHPQRPRYYTSQNF